MINYYTSSTDFGAMTLCWEKRSLYYIGFDEDRALAYCLKKIIDPHRAAQSFESLKDRYFTRNNTEGAQLLNLVLAAWRAGLSEVEGWDLKTNGTMFQQKVWHEIAKIPFGQTLSYGDIAASIGSPKAVRAVGTAVGANPFTLLIPCHRVNHSGGRMSGYAWGASLKHKILSVEQMNYVPSRDYIKFRPIYTALKK